MSENAAIGLIGLGTMGAALALNIADRGYRVAVTNRTTAKIAPFVEAAGPLGERIVPSEGLEEFVRSIERPRTVIVMIQAGKPVDDQIDALMPLLDAGDAIVDAGNANYRDTQRRFELLEGTGIDFVGLGVSGGEEGARHGPSMMMGGSQKSWASMREVAEAIAAKYGDANPEGRADGPGAPCVDRLGPGGAGHFVKTMHNGIEYADMQMIAEVYGMMRDGLGMAPAAMAPVFERWNAGPLASYLIEITAEVLAVDHGGAPIVDAIVDKAGQKGTGRWASIEALTLGVSATAIDEAVAARSLSALKDERTAADALYALGAEAIDEDHGEVLADLEMALLAGKVAAYAQGFAAMRAMSDERGWDVPLARVAEVWRAGCIIRSDFLSVIAEALPEALPSRNAAKGGQPANLLVVPEFVAMVADALPALRRTVARAARHGHPVPALGAALAYVEGYARERGTANLIQAQRDFFGAHGFELIGEEGERHGPWAMTVKEDAREGEPHEAIDVTRGEEPKAKES